MPASILGVECSHGLCGISLSSNLTIFHAKTSGAKIEGS